MSKSLYDAEAAGALLVPLSTIVADTTYPGLLTYPLERPWGFWMLNVSAVAAAGSYTFLLEAASTVAGVYTELARFVWPPGEVTPQQCMLGTSGGTLRLVNPTAAYVRVRALVSGATPSITFTSWLGKPGGAVGLGASAGSALASI